MSGITLTGPEPLTQTPRAWLWSATLLGQPVIVKRRKPITGDGEAQAGAVLRHWQGEGAAKVLWSGADVLVLERLGPQSLGDLSRAGSLQKADDALIAVARKLHLKSASPPAGLVRLEDWISALWQVASPCDATRRAQAIAQYLLSTARDTALMHGDLHHDNILRKRNDWAVIDPIGVLGDPGFEISAAWHNPEGLDAAWADGARHLRLAQRTESRLNIPVGRSLGWAVVRVALSAIWHQQDGSDGDAVKRLLPIYLRQYEQSSPLL